MTGKLIALVILILAAAGGGAMYYLQVYAYYYDVEAQPGRDVMLLADVAGDPAPIAYSDFRAIDADSSPIRYRACFATTESPEDLAARFVTLDEQVPRTAPGWFDCFDAEDIGAELKAGTATAYLSAKNIEYGVDRVVAVTGDGRGYVWHELNNCGKKAYDGTVVGEECPPVPAGN
ncbi:MAG: histidine kinase [Rhodobacteraceae bacterium]|nr:histidine kinase [Paracoccaceae bacterium]